MTATAVIILALAAGIIGGIFGAALASAITDLRADRYARERYEERQRAAAAFRKIIETHRDN